MAVLTALRLVLAAAVLLITTAFLRVLYIMPSSARARVKANLNGNKKSRSHVVIVLGSGGHTGEMMSLLRELDPKRYFHRTYIVSTGDSFSAGKAFEIEKKLQGPNRVSVEETTKAGVLDAVLGRWEVRYVPRARKIHQPLYTAPFSSLWCLIGCVMALNETATISAIDDNGYPDIIITNGPATAVMVIIASFILKFLGLAPVWKMKAVYVESWARVKSLSLSGIVLLRLGLCDKFLVQWETLADSINKGRRKKVDWVGFLVGLLDVFRS